MDEIFLDSNNFLIVNETHWDTKVLGYKTNEIKCIVHSNDDSTFKLLRKFEKFCLKKEYLFSNVRTNPHDLILRRVLTKVGYFNVETSLQVEISARQLKREEKFIKLNFSLRTARLEDLQVLETLSYDIFNHGRFFEDPNISIDVARERNKNWIKDLLSLSEIFVGEINKTIFGFMAFSVEENHAIFLLGGVRSNYVLYSYPFWYKIFLELIDQYKIEYISSVVSASNIRILNLYSYFGFKFSKTYFGYHKHRLL